MRDLSAEQESHAQNKGPLVQNHGTSRQPSVLPGGHGSDHRTSEKLRLRQYFDHRQPQVLPGRHLPTLPENDHGTPNRATLLPAPLPVVRPSPTANIGPRPPFYLPLRTSTGQRVGNLMEPVNGVSPPDRRPI